MARLAAAPTFSLSWSKFLVATTAPVRFGFDFSHLIIAAAGLLPWYFGSARSFWNLASCAARPTPPIDFMAMVAMSFFFARSIHSPTSLRSP